MKLERYRVTKFRSVMDSGWIDCEDITTLVGVNEAGKSNLLLALWKLKPAKGGEIDPLHDLPMKLYSTERDNLSNISFISAEFALDKRLIKEILKIAEYTTVEVSIVHLNRYYDGEYAVSFPNFKKILSIPSQSIIELIINAQKEIEITDEATKSEKGIKKEAESILNSAYSKVMSLDDIDICVYNELQQILKLKTTPAIRSKIKPIITELALELKSLFTLILSKQPHEIEEIKNLIIQEIPPFVYYSNYGNLDSQIYLPHAIKWMKGEKIQGIDNTAKVRTLRVLFDFVNLNPQEILDLGKDPKILAIEKKGENSSYIPSQVEIENASLKKTERSILLQSASNNLTQEFKDWWKQGSYIFRFQADGEYFKIWVSDDKRPEEIELEGRSTGLQWFLSFYLVFLVESQDSHKNAILLLDEAGLSLHPLAQKDLITFFDNLSENNQLIHTTHSPFLINTNSIERVKAVYIDDEGYTVASSNLRTVDKKFNENSIYAVHAALGLSVSDIILQGCRPIIVEGPSDQHYFNAIKLFLIKINLLTPSEELIFMPSGGVKGVSGIVSLISGKDEKLPYVILDSDRSGIDARNKLTSNLYSGQSDYILTIGDFISLDQAEVEDLIPISLMVKYLNKLFRDIDDEEFMDSFENDSSVIKQIEDFARKYDITLEKGWKVEMAKSVKVQLFKIKPEDIPNVMIDNWRMIFNKLVS